MNEIEKPMSNSFEPLTKAVNELCDVIEQYVDDELVRSEQDIKGDYIRQMRENPKLKRSLRVR